MRTQGRQPECRTRLSPERVGLAVSKSFSHNQARSVFLCATGKEANTETSSDWAKVTSGVSDTPTPEWQSSSWDPGYLSTKAELGIGVLDTTSF